MAFAYDGVCFWAGPWTLVAWGTATVSSVVVSSVEGVSDPVVEGRVNEAVLGLGRHIYGKGGRGEPRTWLSKCRCATVEMSWQNA